MDRIRSSEITDRDVYLNRRRFIGAGLAIAGGIAIERSATAFGRSAEAFALQAAPHGRKLTTVRSPLSTNETPNTWEHIKIGRAHV